MDHRTLFMDSRLYQASVKGDVNTLDSLIHENPPILEKATVGRLSQNPLHIAASVGHLAFTRALLSLNPNLELATKSDSRGRFPLHLASEKGHVEIVRELLLHPNDAVCLQVDKKGRIPLHFAAMQGHVNVIMELIGARPESIDMVTKKEMELVEPINMVTNKEMELIGETVLHLCVRYNRLEALKLLLDLAPSDSLVSAQDNDGNTVLHLCVRYNLLEALKLLLDLAPSDSLVSAQDNHGNTVLHLCVRYNRLEALKLLLDLAPSSLVSAQDNHGNTVLHLAAALKNSEIVKYLLSLPDVKELLAPMMNKKNFTALDVLEQPTITDDKSTNDNLLQAELPKAQKIERFLRKYLRMDDSCFKDSRGYLIITSTVIATVAFQAGVTPPGGVWQDDGNGPIQGSHEAGTSIIATKISSLHTEYVIYNTFSFATSLIVILLLISGVAFKNNVLMRILNMAMLYSIISMVLAYSVSVQMMIPGTDSRRTVVVITCRSAASICYAVFSFVTLPCAFEFSNWVTSKLSKLTGKVQSKLKGKDQSNLKNGSSGSDHSEA